MSLLRHVHPALFITITVLTLFCLADEEALQFKHRDLPAWKEYRAKYNRRFSHDDDEERHAFHFNESLTLLNDHNFLYESGMKTFKLAINHLSDLSEALYNIRSGARRPKRRPVTVAPPTEATADSATKAPLPDEVDWRQKGLVTPVKEQGLCSSCWAFAATGAIEGQYAKATGQLVRLSEQNLIDCGRQFGTRGCSGGWADEAFDYVRANGIDTEDSYPYTTNTETCKHNISRHLNVTVIGFADLPSENEEALKEAVATIGPIASAIDASLLSFKNYGGGVYFDALCNSSSLTHGVLVVGYGNDASLGDFWTVKNSWSAEWGERGFFRIARNRNNHCGIATAPSYPLVKME